MYVKNTTQKNQCFKAAGVNFNIKPGKTAMMSQEVYDDHITQLLISRGALVKLEDKEGQKQVLADQAEKAAKAEERKVEVKQADSNREQQVIMVQCAATKNDGNRCMTNVSVPIAEHDDDTPYFCKVHKKQKASDYEKVDGAWVKKSSQEPEKKEEEPKAEEQTTIDDFVSDDFDPKAAAAEDVKE